MLMMVPLGVTFWLASELRGAAWMVWFIAVGVGVGPAIGALVGGWTGMWSGFGWFVVLAVFAYAVGFVAMIWSYLVQAVSGSEPGLEAWSVCAVLLPVVAGIAIGAGRGGWKGALRGVGTGIRLLAAASFLLFAIVMVTLFVRALIGR